MVDRWGADPHDARYVGEDSRRLQSTQGHHFLAVASG